MKCTFTNRDGQVCSAPAKYFYLILSRSINRCSVHMVGSQRNKIFLTKEDRDLELLRRKL